MKRGFAICAIAGWVAASSAQQPLADTQYAPATAAHKPLVLDTTRFRRADELERADSLWLRYMPGMRIFLAKPDEDFLNGTAIPPLLGVQVQAPWEQRLWMGYEQDMDGNNRATFSIKCPF